MAQRSEVPKDNPSQQPVIDPAAEKPAKAPRVRNSASKQPTGKDEERFYQDSGEEYKLQHRQQDLGALGKFFGGSTSAPTNIAGFIAVVGVLALIISFLIRANTDSIDGQRLADAQKLLIGLITSALSFIFGAASKK